VAATRLYADPLGALELPLFDPAAALEDFVEEFDLPAPGVAPSAVPVAIIVIRSGMRWHPGMEYRETRSYQRILYIFKRPRAGTVLKDQQLWMLLRAGHRFAFAEER